MIQRHRPHALRRSAGIALIAALIAGTAVMAQGVVGKSDAPAAQNLQYNLRQPPRYPAAAIKNKQQGTVVLQVLVHADGSVGNIEYDTARSTTRSAELIAAATEAAQRWHFNPQMKDGRAIEGYVRIPVTFSLDETASTAPNEAKKTSSK